MAERTTVTVGHKSTRKDDDGNFTGYESHGEWVLEEGDDPDEVRDMAFETVHDDVNRMHAKHNAMLNADEDELAQLESAMMGDEE